MRTAPPPPNTNTDPWLTVQQCAERAQCSERTIRRLIRARALRHARVGVGRKNIRVRASWLDAALERLAEPMERAW